MDSQAKTAEIDVAYVAHLARMHLTDEECARFQPQLAAVVDYVRKMQEVNLDGVEPTAHVQPLQNVFRADEVQPGLDRDVAMANAPEQTDGQFQVPKIVE